MECPHKTLPLMAQWSMQKWKKDETAKFRDGTGPQRASDFLTERDSCTYELIDYGSMLKFPKVQAKQG